jgi:tripeptidyl-peptidase-1
MAILSTLRLVGLLSLASLQAYAAVTLESISSSPSGWSLSGTPDDSSQIVLQIALAQQNMDQLESKLAAVSTPNSPSYGQYLDLDNINSFFGASNESVSAVEAWLKSSGVISFSKQSDSIWFKTNLSTANAMLDTTFNTYSDSTGATKLRTTSYSVPESVASHIDLISPTTYFGKTKAMRSIKSKTMSKRKLQNMRASHQRRQEPAACQGSIVFQNATYETFTPDCIRQEYGVDGYTPLVSSGSRIAFGSFLNESASFSDLALFEAAFGFPSQNFSVVLVNPQDGATDLPQPPDPANDGEANLDVQNIVTIAQ